MYVCEELGSYYWMEEGELCTTPMNANDGIVEFESGCMVEREHIDNDIITFQGEKMPFLDVLDVIQKELTK